MTNDNNQNGRSMKRFPLLIKTLVLVSVMWMSSESSAQVVVSEGFDVRPFATVFQPSGIALAPENSPFGKGLFVGSWGEAPPQDQVIEDKIYRLSADGTPTLFATLLAEADPVSLKFSNPGSAFGHFLYVSSNNRDNHTHGDCGGTIQTVDISGNVSDFTSLTSSFRCPSLVSTALGEPSGIVFGPGGAFGEDLYVANSAEEPSDIVRVDPLANVIPFVNDGRFSRTRAFGLAPVDVTFGPGGDFGSNLYFTENGQFCNCVRIADATGGFSPPFASFPGNPVSLKFGPGGPFGTDLYVAVLAPGNSSIFRVKPDGSATVFATGFSGFLSAGSFEFSADGTTMYVLDTSGNTVYRIDPAFTNITVIDTISTVDIDLDETSITPLPSDVRIENGQTQIEWRFENLSIGQIEEMHFDVVLRNPNAGEDRLVSHRVELFYSDVNGNPVHVTLPSRFVHVLSSAVNPVLSTDRPEYTAHEDVLINFSTTNLSGFSRTVDVRIDVEDDEGQLVQSVGTLSGVVFNAGETKTFSPFIFNTGTIFSGPYRVRARLTETGVQIGETRTDFQVLPVLQAISTITTDKIAYSSNESVRLSSTITGQNINSALENLEATVRITAPDGLEIFSETRPVPDLLPEARFTFQSFTNTGTHPAGLYTVHLGVTENGAPLTAAETGFEIISSLDQANALAGTIQFDPASILETEQTTLSYTVQNIGNVLDLPEIMITILLVDPDTEEVVRTIATETGLNGRESFSDIIQFDSTGLTPKPYLAVLQGTTAGITQTLDSTGLQINPRPNTAPTAEAGPNQTGLTQQPVYLDGTASTDPDGDPLTFSWQFISIPEGSLLTDATLSNANTSTPEFIPDVEGIYTLSLVVNDGVLDSPADIVSVFINPAPRVDIHPETINLKSNGGSKSVTGVLKSPVLSSFELFTAEDGITVTGSFSLLNTYVDLNGEVVVFEIPGDDYPGDDFIEAVDSDGNGTIDQYQLTLKFNRDLLIAVFTDENGALRIADPTDLISTVIGNTQAIGSDTNQVILPPKVSKGK